VPTNDPDYGCNATSCASCGAMGFKNVRNATCHPMTGTCAVTSCNSTFAHCEGDISQGCETSLLVSDMHCGSCNNSCLLIVVPNTPQVHCMNGECAVTECANGWFDCNRVPTDGCECAPGKTCVNQQCM
jgi:hypothetical protein